MTIAPQQAVYLTLPKGAAENLSIELTLNDELVAPLAQGDVLGSSPCRWIVSSLALCRWWPPRRWPKVACLSRCWIGACEPSIEDEYE